MDNFSAVKIKTIIFINEYFVQKYINLLKENKNYKVSSLYSKQIYHCTKSNGIR